MRIALGAWAGAASAAASGPAWAAPSPRLRRGRGRGATVGVEPALSLSESPVSPGARVEVALPPLLSVLLRYDRPRSVTRTHAPNRLRPLDTKPAASRAACCGSSRPVTLSVASSFSASSVSGSSFSFTFLPRESAFALTYRRHGVVQRAFFLAVEIRRRVQTAEDRERRFRALRGSLHATSSGTSTS